MAAKLQSCLLFEVSQRSGNRGRIMKHNVGPLISGDRLLVGKDVEDIFKDLTSYSTYPITLVFFRRQPGNFLTSVSPLWDLISVEHLVQDVSPPPLLLLLVVAEVVT